MINLIEGFDIENFKYENYYNSVDGSLENKIQGLAKILDFADDKGLNTLRRQLVSSSGSRVKVLNRDTNKERDMLMFGSNNYLGLTTHPKVKQAAVEAIVNYGVGSGGVPLLSGTHWWQDQLEKKLAKLKGCQDAMLFSSGYAANIGCITGLMREDDLVINDKLNHASIIDGCRLSQARYVSFKHNSPNSLENILKLSARYKARTMVCLDGVYSMDGDIAVLDRICPIAKEYGALVMIDDAHATGVIGEHGAGTKSHYKIQDGVDIVVGTLSKAIGTVGGFIASTKEIIDYLRIYARSNMFSTALPPSVCAAANAAVSVMETEPQLIQQLKYNSEYVKSNLIKLGYVLGKSETAIIPVIVKDEERMLLMSQEIDRCGIFVNTITSPVVPIGQARFRVSVMAPHTQDDLDTFLNVMESVGRKYKVI